MVWGHKVGISEFPSPTMKEQKQLLTRCTCGAHHFLELSWFEEDDKDKEYKTCYVSITLGAEGILERIKGAIEVLKGGRYSLAEEVVLTKKEVRKIIKFLENYLKTERSLT